MPRPKVHPSQRRRAAEACDFCRNSKKRCSATVPCTACVRRGIASSCFLTNQPRGAREAARQARLDNLHQPKEHEECNVSPAQTLLGTSPETGWKQNQDINPELNSMLSGDISATQSTNTIGSVVGLGAGLGTNIMSHGHGQVTPPLGQESHARMLLNLRGERVYIGQAASLSFLKFVRDTVASQIGPSQFSLSEKSDRMFESEPSRAQTNASSDFIPNLTFEDIGVYSAAYDVATAGFLDLFSISEASEILNKGLDQDPASSSSVYRFASNAMLIAIGAQCQSPDTAQRIALPLFRKAQRSAFAGMLEDPDIELVRSFLLMAFYLLGACRRNTAFMYLGIAARSAVALGLHSRESYMDNSNEENLKRLKIWTSLCVLDMLVSSILGRPSATADLRFEFDQPLINIFQTSSGLKGTCLLASYQVMSIANDAVDQLYSKRKASTALIQAFMAKMENWSQSLPPSLRTPQTTLSSQSLSKETIGSIHVSCLYYYSVTLITRPILISALTKQFMSATSPLAAACLDAAIFLSQTCAEARTMGLILGNMCIMKALVFAAGLILGFSMFAKREIDYEVEAAFSSARNVLGFLGEQSPQAAHYSDILHLLSNSIIQQRGKCTTRGRSRLVGKIFSLDALQDHTNSTGDASGQYSAMSNLEMTLEDDTGNPTTNQTEFDSTMFQGWDSLDLSQWDSFPFDSPRNFTAE